MTTKFRLIPVILLFLIIIFFASAVPLFAQTWTETVFTTGAFANTTTTTGSADVILRYGPLSPVVWAGMAPAPGTIGEGGALCYPGSGNFIYAFGGNNTNAFYRYSISGNSWVSSAVSPTIVAPAQGVINYGGALCYPGSGDFIYGFKGFGATAFYRYSISGNVWGTMQPAPGSISYGGALVSAGGDYIYGFAANYTDVFYRYSILSNSWVTRTVVPGVIGTGGALGYPGTDDFIYGFAGGGLVNFWRYSISGNAWLARASAPGTIGGGGALCYPGSGDFIYGFKGSATTAFYRYAIAGTGGQPWNTWRTLAPAPGVISIGGALCYPGSGDFIYGFAGGLTTAFYRCQVLGYPSSGTYTSTAIAAIAPSIITQWGVLTFTSNAPPVSTTFWVDVLRSSDNAVLLANVPSGIDLSLYSTMTGVTGIRLRANFGSNTLVTPTLSDWTVSYSIDSPPVLTSPGDRTIDAGQPLTFTLVATDPESDPISYSMVATPTGATLNPSSGLFSWTPLYTQSGLYPVTFTATSTIFSDSQAITITVNAVVRPDLLVSLPSPVNYIGNDIYADSASPQVIQQYTDNNATVTYLIRVQNDRQADTFSLTASAAVGGWTVSYYDDIGDITVAMRNNTYTRTIGANPTSYDYYRVEVTPNGTVPLSSTLLTYFYAYSVNDPTAYDAVQNYTIVRYLQPDNWIKLSTDGSYTGNGITNTDGTNQTVTNTLTNNATGTYHIVLENDSNVTETMLVTGSGASSGWSVSYYEGLSGGNDITVAVLNGAYSRTNMAPAVTYTIRIEVSSGAVSATSGNSAITSTILSQSSSNPARQDMVRSVTTVLPNYTVDNRVALSPYGTYEGNDSYNETGTGQTDTTTNITPLSTVTYSVRIENDGNLTTQVTLTASASAGGWTVTYYDGIDTAAAVIPAVITSTGWLRPSSIAAGGYANICVEIRPDAAVLGGAAGEYTNYLRIISPNNSSVSDTIRTRTRTNVVYQAGSGISNVAGGPYLDMSVTSTDGASQSVTQTVQTNVTVTYYIRLENDGNVQDTFSITGTGSNGWWAVTYYSAATGGSNITNSITGTGWSWGPVTPFNYAPVSTTIRAEVTPLTDTSGATYTIYPTIRSQGSGWSALDVVRANTVCFFRPDLRYDTVFAGTYTTGNGTYADNNPPLGSPAQDYSQYADSDTTITYFVRVENDGSNDTFSLTASAPVASWTISYYNATAGGTDITTAMRNGTYTRTVNAATSYDYRVEVTGNGVISGNSSTAYFYSYSTANFDSYDAIGLTTIVRGYQADGMVKRGSDPDVNYIGNNITNTDGTSQTITNTLTNSQMVSYHIRIQNDGNTTQTISVSGSPATSGWTITYYDSETGSNNITAQVLGGTYSQTGIAPTVSYTIRLEVAAADRLTLAGGAVLTNTVRTQPLNTGTGQDVVRCVTEVIKNYTIDNLVAVSPTYTPYAGDNTYNSTGISQTDTTMTIPVNGTITYLVKIENDGNVATQVTLTGTPATAVWSVTYYDGISTAAAVIPNNQITGSNGFLRTSSITSGGSANICVELKPATTTLGGLAGEYTGYVKIISVANASVSDTIRTRTQTNVFYRADSGIRNPAEGSYIDMAITSTNGAGQTKAQSILNSGTVTYYIRIENDGNSDDLFSITGTSGNADWAITYYDAETGGVNITNSITGTGWSTGVLSPVASAGMVKVLRAEIKVITTTPGAVFTMYVTARSQGGAWSVLDVVKSDTTLGQYRPDLHIRRSTDPSYTVGLDEYEPTVQTSPQQTAATGQIVTFYVRIQNDGGVSSIYTLTGTGSDSSWTVSYYDMYNGIDIPVGTMIAGYEIDPLLPGQSREIIRVEVSHNGTPPGGVPYYHYIRARAELEPTEADTVRTATVTPDYQPDNLISLPPGYIYEGDAISNTSGAGQSDTVVSITALSTVTYLVKIENDGNSNTNVTVTGSGSGLGWTVTYYESPTRTLIANITGIGWTINNLLPLSYKEIEVEVSSDNSVLAGALGEKIIYVKSIAVNSPSQSDTVKAQIRTNILYRADSGISASVVGPYADMAITSTDGTNQAVQQDTSTGEVVSYYIRLENDGNTDDTFSVTGTGSNPGNWVVTYYDNDTGLTITGVTGIGWSWGPMSPVGVSGQYKIIRLEVNPMTSTIGAEYPVLVNVISKNSGFVARDVVNATTKVQSYYQTDLLVKEQSEGSYTGGNYYTTDPSSQSLSLKSVNNSQTITYCIKIENDGLNNDTFTITGIGGGYGSGGPSSGSWAVSYYDALTGGGDITNRVVSNTPSAYTVPLSGTTGTGYIRVEVMPGANVYAHGATPNIFTVTVTAISSGTGNLVDALRTQTAVNTQFKPDGLIRNGTDTDVLGNYAGYNLYSTDNSQLKTQGVNNNATITYYVRMQNDGNYTDRFSLSGTASQGGWTVSYYNPGNNDITLSVVAGSAQTPSGVLTPFQTDINGLMYKIEVTPDGSVVQGTQLDVWFKINSQGDNTKKDYCVARAVLNTYRPDLYIRQSTEGYNNSRDNGIYEWATAISQTSGPTNIDSGAYITYYIKIENDGDATDRFTITGTSTTVSPTNWTISYYNVSGGANITSAINSGGWLSDVVTAGGYAEIYIEVKADNTQKGLSNNIYVGGRSYNSSVLKRDLVKASINVNVNYQADMMITSTAQAGFIGDGTWNLDGSSQTLSTAVNNSQTVTYYLRIQNDGDSPDKFSITGSTAPAGWTITYYNVGTNITSQVTSLAGWYNASLDLAVGASYTVRAELTPGASITGTSQAVLYVTGISQGSIAKKDVVKAVCEVNSSYTVNNWVGATTPTYDTTSAAQPANNNQVVTYYIKVENTGNTNNTVTVTGTGSDSNWIVTYYDAVTGTNDITVQVTGGTYQLTAIPAFGYIEMRVNAEPKAQALGASNKALTVQTRSTGTGNPTDSVTGTTTVNNTYMVNSWVGVTTGTYNTLSAAQTTNNSQTVTYYIKIDNTGNSDNSVTIGGTTGDSDWVVSYYDAPNGMNDVTPQVVGMTYQPTPISAFSYYEMRIEASPKSGVAGSSVKALTVNVKSVDDPTKSDTITATTTTNDYGINSWVGITTPTYNTTSAAQSMDNDAGQAVTYYIKIDNTGDMPNTVTVSGTSGDSDWVVSYYDVPTGTDRTNLVVLGTYQPTAIPALGNKEIRVEVKPAVNVTGTSQKALVINAKSITLPNPADTITATTTVSQRYKVDSQIARLSELPVYTGNNTYETLPTVAQTKTDIISNNQTLTYYVRLENDGNMLDAFSLSKAITATGSAVSEWLVTYYNEVGTDITTAVNAGSWITNNLNWSVSEYIRVEITPNISVTGGSALELVLTGRSTGGSATDAVRIGLSCTGSNQPDMLVVSGANLTITPTLWTGYKIYNTTAISQTINKVVTKASAISYYVRIYNDGNNADTYTITGTSSGSSWTVIYYDGVTDITAQVIGSGWATAIGIGNYKEMIVYISAPDTAEVSRDVNIVAVSQSDISKKDALKISLSTGGVWVGVPSGTQNGDAVPPVNLEGKTVGQRPVIIGRTSPTNYNKTVTLVDIEGRTVGSAVSDATEGYYRIEVTVDLPLTQTNNSITPWVDGNPGATINITVVASPITSQVPQMVLVSTGSQADISIGAGITPTIKVKSGKIKFKGYAAPSSNVVLQMASKLDLNVGSAMSDGLGDYEIETDDPLIRGVHTFSVVCNGVVSNLITLNLIDPYGVVFDSLTGEVIEGAIVRIVPITTGAIVSTPPPGTVALDGYTQQIGPNGFSWNAEAGSDFRLEVIADKYTFPTKETTWNPIWWTTWGYTNTSIAGAWKGLSYTQLTEPLEIDLPVDATSGILKVTKTANKSEVTYGDVITYDVRIENNNAFTVSDVALEDIMPPGLKYLDSGVRILAPAGATKVTPTTVSGTTKRFSPVTLTANTSVTYRYQLVVGAGVVFGEYKNTARAVNNTNGSILSNNSKVRVLVVPDALFDYATIIGKVFNDANGDGVQDEGERGVAGVKIMTEDGIIVITDKDGKYHLAGLRPQTRLLKIDASSLPLNTKFTTPHPMVVRFTGGGRLEKVNFGVQVIQGKVEGKASITAEISVIDGVPEIKLGGEKVPLKWSTRPPATDTVAVSVEIQGKEITLTENNTSVKEDIVLTDDNKVKIWARDSKGRELETEYRVTLPKLEVTVKREIEQPVLIPELGIALTPEILEIKRGRLVKAARFKIVTNYQGFVENWKLQILEATKGDGSQSVIPAKAGIQYAQSGLDSRLHGNDNGKGYLEKCAQDEGAEPDAQRPTQDAIPAGYRVFKEFQGTRASIEKAIIWDGKSDNGRLVEENKTYKYLLTLMDAEGRQDTSVTGQFMVQSTWTRAIKDALGIQPTPVKEMLLPIKMANGIQNKEIPIAGRLYRITGTTDPTNTVIISTANTPNITTVTPLEDGRFEAEVYLPATEEQIIVEVMSKGNLKRKLLTSDIRIEKDKDKYFFLAGMADVMAGSNSWEGDEATLDALAKNNVRYNKGSYTEFRLAAFLKSRTEDWTIAGSVDSDRVTMSHETRQLFKYLDPDKFYPMYGDTSTRIDEASNTQGPLYLKADNRNGYGFLIGNYNTNIAGSELAQYNRSLYGLQLGYNTPVTSTPNAPRSTLNLFVASANQMASRDEMRGTGGSLYYLKNKNVREGSEKITVETRDKVSGLSSGSQVLKPYEDYEIDYTGGRIILTKPLHSVGASNSIVATDLLEGNPVYLTVDYEYEPEQWWDFNKEAMGTRVVQTLDNLTIGVTYVKEEKDLTDYTLMGTDLAAKLGKNMDARLEYAQSESEGIPGYISYNGGLDYASLPTASSADGAAYKLTLGADIGALLNKNPGEIMGKTYYAKTEAGFSSNATVSQQGSEKMGLEVGAKLSDNDTLLSRFDSQKVLDGANAAVQNTAGATESKTLVLQIAHRQDPVRVTGEYRYQDTLTPYITPGLLRDEPSQIIAGRAEYDMDKNMNVFGEQQMALAGKPNNQTTVGANMKLSDKITGNIQQTFGTLGNSTMFGITTNVKDGTEKHSLYANYQITQDASGAQNYNMVMGEKEQVSSKLNIYRENRFTARRGAEEGNFSALFGTGYTLNENWLMNATYERSQVDNISLRSDSGVPPQAGTQSRDALATEAIYNSHPAEKDKTKIVGYMNGVIRIEARSEKGAQERTSYLTANRLFYQANEDLSISVKGYMSETTNDTTKLTEAKFAEGGVAFAYRPVKYDKYNFIGKMNYLEDQATPAQSPNGITTDTKAIVLAVEGGVDVMKQLQIVEKLAYRKNIENVSGMAELDKDVSLIALRFNYRLMSESKFLDKWILGLEYRMLSVSLAEDQKTGIVFEVDREVSNNLLFGFGYNLVDFSDDLTTLGRDYKVKGAFIRLTAKY